MATRITKELITGIGLVADRTTVSLRQGLYEVSVRKLNAGETIAFIELNDTDDRAKQLEVMTKIVIAICVNEDGTQLFEDSDRELVCKSFSLDDMTKIVSAATGMETEAVTGKSEASSEATA